LIGFEGEKLNIFGRLLRRYLRVEESLREGEMSNHPFVGKRHLAFEVVEALDLTGI
jgi:hypothetical protein